MDNVVEYRDILDRQIGYVGVSVHVPARCENIELSHTVSLWGIYFVYQ